MMVCTFLRGGFMDLHAPMAPLSGELSAKRIERLLQIGDNLSVSAAPSHLPWKGRL